MNHVVTALIGVVFIVTGVRHRGRVRSLGPVTRPGIEMAVRVLLVIFGVAMTLGGLASLVF